jgi:hypothetical protein
MDEIVMKGRLGRGVVVATFVASLSLVASLVTSTYVLSRAYVLRGEQAYRRTQTLDVRGWAKMRLTSDLALWDIRVGGEGKTLEEAFQKLAPTSDAVHAFLTERGFTSDAVKLTAINTTENFRTDEKGRETRELLSYTLSRRFEVTSSDVGRVAKAAGEVTELLKTGAHVESLSPRFVYTRLADLKVRMIGEATANGRERAERIAAESKCRIGALKEARAGVLQVTTPWSTEVSDTGVDDTSTIEKDAKSVVHLTFIVEPA